MPLEMRSKIGLFCSVRPENVLSAYDVSNIYEVPLLLNEQGFDASVVKRLGLSTQNPELSGWQRMVETLKQPRNAVTIGIVGKYVDLKESYKSLNEAIVHGGIANHSKVEVRFIDSEKLEKSNVAETLKEVDGILVPGGFGERGAEGKIIAIQYARENQIPFFGICFGMQLATIEFARNVCGIVDATSREFVAKGARNLVIDFMEEQRHLNQKGGTMRLGAYPCNLKPNTLAHKVYGKPLIYERHRHRYELNNKFKPIFEKRGMVLSGRCEERDLVEIVEIPEHPWFIGVQFHPEFKSRPMHPHPLFTHFVRASLEHKQRTRQRKNSPGKKPRRDVRNGRMAHT